MKDDIAVSTSQYHGDEGMERFRLKVIGLLSPDMRELYEHERLAAPLGEVLCKMRAQGYLEDQRTAMEELAEQAQLQAMAAWLAMSEVPSALSAKALSLMVEAWNRLHDACLLASNEEDL